MSLLRYLRFLIVLIAIGLFVASCELPAVRWQVIPGPPEYFDQDGAQLLGLGWLGVLFSLPAGLAWLANPVFVAACAFLIARRNRVALGFGTGAVLLGFSFTYSSKWFPLLGDEGGVTHWAFRQGLAGFWLWLLAPAVIAFYAFSLWFEQRRGAGRAD